MNRFELEGVTYYQQGRKCGKPTCGCAEGKLHGPYWYARDVWGGKVKYLGKELPPEIARARAAHADLSRAMDEKHRELTRQARALSALIHNTRLSDDQVGAVAALGFGDALVRKQ